jgi:hypothetical protein
LATAGGGFGKDLGRLDAHGRISAKKIETAALSCLFPPPASSGALAEDAAAMAK